MELAVRSFLLFLRNIVSFFRKQWNRSARKLWYILALLHSRFSSRRPKKDEVLRSIESGPTKLNSTSVICASQFPPTITPIDVGDSSLVASPEPVTIRIDKSTILDAEDGLYESDWDQKNDGADADADGHLFGRSGSISRSLDFSGDHGEPEPIRGLPPPNRRRFPPSSPVVFSPPSLRPPSQYSHHPASQRAGSQCSHRPQSEYSHRSSRNSNGAEAAARGYISALPSPRPPSPAVSICPPTIVGSVVRFGPSPTPPPNGRLRPMIAIDRYEKHKSIVVKDVAQDHFCLPVTTRFVRESAPENWIPLMHPEGALYWVHEKDPIYTDTNMCDPDLRQMIEEALEEINMLKENCPPLPVDDWELVLELGEDRETGELICFYYFVCHSSRCLFWLHEFDLESALNNLRGVSEPTHIHLALQSQYWYHWEVFPHDREVPEHLVQELLGILVHAGVDCMTSRDSTAIYSEGDLSKLLGYVKNITSVGGSYGFSACVVGRLMSFFMHSRYVNFYGQKGARLTNDQTIYGLHPRRTCLIKILSIFFFHGPQLYLSELESIYTDYVICQHRWVQFITRLQDSWKEFVLYGVILLNANVAFLAIPSVDPGNHSRTPTQIAGYLSIITSVGSIVIGLLLLRYHKSRPQESAEEVDNYLRSQLHSALGLEKLAILYSLPCSLLLWSLIAFTVAFSLEALVFSRQMWARLSVGIALAMMILLISWCVWTATNARAGSCVFGCVHLLTDRLVDFTRGLRGKITNPGPSDEGSGDQGKGGSNQRLGTFKDAFEFIRGRRRQRASTSSTLVGVNLTEGDKSSGQPGGGGVGSTGGVNEKEPDSVV